ncbi:ABC transporter ATP-binding protein [Halomarina oriensis]|uniref:ATP-binding cassette domain-containing protein n=1 Tax=Halomarina oriensis TaxID=671145 RepID=A0A6B0GQI3_9EURY|nr:ABC transporter ATP-binding protein [Halomarina oriensis]MWG34385.1 ATP-binding cassette domain-containing protein [Halomarina oriensis]
MSARTLLEVKGLKKHYPITQGVLKKEVGRVRAVDGVDFSVSPGETLGIVGESGCGKSTVATSLLRLEEPTAGDVLFEGEDITTYDKAELKRFRRRAQMIFQDPTASFDPRMSIGESVGEPLLIHGISDRNRRREIVKDLLERVGLSADDIDRYPHEFSGGQKQRVALARALVVNPELIVADEPVSALDVSIQADILSLMNDIQAEFDLAMLFISHNLGVIREVCDRVAVMYLGEIVEIAPTEELFSNPQHPYTRALLGSIPQPDPRQRGESITLSGDVPSPSNPPAGCRFHTRCPDVIPPEGYEFEQRHWRSVQDLRQRMRKGPLDLETVRTAHSDAAGDGHVQTAEDGQSVLDDEGLKAGIREEFDIPQRLSDDEAEDVLDRALTAEVSDDHESGRDLLDEEFQTPCEQTAPELRETSAGWEAACLLHDEQRQRVEQPADD